jgi:choice-of-anchor A domain-containing protein
MKSMVFAAAAIACSLLAPSALAQSVFDYDVYSDGAASGSGGSYGDVAARPTNAAAFSGGLFTSLSASSNAMTSQALAFSTTLKGLATNGGFSSSAGAGLLTSTVGGFGVFSLTAAQFTTISSLSFTGPGDGAIVNVSGGIIAHTANMNFGSLDPSRVIFNFYDASQVIISNAAIPGTILAPKAYVNLSGINVSGTVIAKTFAGSGNTVVGGTPFVLNAVPEPATWAMMIAGFGAIGGALRARRRRERVVFA